MMTILEKSDAYQQSKTFIKTTLESLLSMNIVHRESVNKGAYIYTINFKNIKTTNMLTYKVMRLPENHIIKKIKYMTEDKYLFYASLLKVLLLNFKINLQKCIQKTFFCYR